MNELKAVKNKYGGIFVSSDNLPESREEFEQLLPISLSEWLREEIKVAWIQIPAEKSQLIQVAIANGFEFHHCSTTELMLIKRLIPDAYVPLSSTHTIAAGGVVISERRELLTILERRDLIARPGYYKLPGGMLERGEHFADGVVREVFEETGIRTEFQGLLSLRHHHRGQFGASNIYAVCRLKPLSYDISIDDVEIGDALWLPVEEYLASEEVGLYNKQVVKAALSASPLASIKIPGYMDRPEDYEIYLPENVT